MSKNVSFEVLCNQLANVFQDGKQLEVYSRDPIEYSGVTGWCGVMSPITHAAYISTFGTDMVAAAEKEARRIIAEKKQVFEATNYYKYSLLADAWRAAGCAAPEAGGFIWAVTSGLKGDGGQYIKELSYLTEDDDPRQNRLFRVDEVFEVDDIFTADYIRLIADNDLADKCGSSSEDVTENFNRFNPTKEELSTFYTFGVVVVDKLGRWLAIDTEGYNYTRSFYSRPDYVTAFADEIALIKEERERQRRAEEERAEKERQERRDAYLANCKKWEHLMTDITPARAKCTAARAEYSAAGYRSKTPQHKAYLAAKRELLNVKKGNILAMCRAAFPGQKFSVTKYDGWGHDWDLTWIDGPTKEELLAATNLSLFEACVDTFDGMTDYADTETAEFTEFAAKYIGDTSGEIRVTRKESDKVNLLIKNEFATAFPDVDVTKEYKGISDNIAHETARKFRFKLRHSFCGITIGGLLRQIFDSRSYYVAPTQAAPAKPQAKPTPTHADIQIIDYSEKAVAVVGDTRSIKEHLKTLGGRFNPRLSCGAGWIFSKKKETELKQLIGA